MAKLSKKIKLTRALKRLEENETYITEIFRESIVSYWLHGGNPSLISCCLTASKESNLSDKHKKDLINFVVSFCPISVKKDVNDNELYDGKNHLILVKDHARHAKKTDDLSLWDYYGDREAVSGRLNFLIDQYLNARGGSVFGVARDINKDQVWVKEHYRTTANDHVLVTGHWRNC